MNAKPYHFETLALHAGQTVDATQSRGVPVYRTSSYVFKNTQHAANLFALKELGNIYTRLMNPTTDVLEQRVSQLEGGAASVAVSSGTSAVFYSIITLAEAGDEIVSASNLYGGTYTQFDAILPKLGITTRFVDARDPRTFEKAITAKTRALFVETIGNPTLDFTDIGAVAAIAHRHGIPLVVDGTFTTPWLLRAIEHGADIVVNSLTKWIGGHGTAVGGIITDAGTFDWKAATRCSPSPTPITTACAGRSTCRPRCQRYRSPCGCGSSRSAISAPASRPTTHGSFSRGSKPCRCAWGATAKTRCWSRSTLRNTRRRRGCAIRDSRRTLRTRRRADTLTKGMVAWSCSA